MFWNTHTMRGSERSEKEEDPPVPAGIGALWPLPPASAGHRALTVLGFIFELALAVAVGGIGVDVSWRTANPTRILTMLADGEEHTFSAAVYGAPSWCPRFPDSGTLALSMGAVWYSQGIGREIPVTAGLAPRRVHAPRTLATPQRLPRSWWVLEVDAPQGTAFIAAPLDELALLGAVASWPVPIGWPHGKVS